SITCTCADYKSCNVLPSSVSSSAYFRCPNCAWQILEQNFVCQSSHRPDIRFREVRPISTDNQTLTSLEATPVQYFGKRSQLSGRLFVPRFSRGTLQLSTR